MREEVLLDRRLELGQIFGRWFAAGKTLFPPAATLAKLAAFRGDFSSGENLEPVYLRATNFLKASAQQKTLVS